MLRCEDVKMLRCEDVKMFKVFLSALALKRLGSVASDLTFTPSHLNILTRLFINIEHHLAENSVGSILAYEHLCHLASNSEACSCATTSDELAITHACLLQNLSSEKLVFELRIACCLVAIEQAHATIDHRSSTHSCKPLALLCIFADDLCQRL